MHYFQDNYGYHTPYKVDYGYSGRGYSQGTLVPVMMAGAAGVAVGVVVGVGGYYAYNRYSESTQQGQVGVPYQAVQWCKIPTGEPNEGGMIECQDCIREFGNRCVNEDSCFSSGGCNYKLPKDTLRDDLMDSGFLPKHYKSPIKIRITDIVGTEFQEANICPMANNISGQTKTQFVRASSFQTNLFVTITQMSPLTGAVCSRDTHGKCVNNQCNPGEECVSGWCQCEQGRCYNQTIFSCSTKIGTTGAAPLQARLSLLPAAVVLLICLRALKHLF